MPRLFCEPPAGISRPSVLRLGYVHLKPKRKKRINWEKRFKRLFVACERAVDSKFQSAAANRILEDGVFYYRSKLGIKP